MMTSTVFKAEIQNSYLGYAGELLSEDLHQKLLCSFSVSVQLGNSSVVYPFSSILDARGGCARDRAEVGELFLPKLQVIKSKLHVSK